MPARIAMPISIERGDFLRACADFVAARQSEEGNPKAFTKQAAASAAVNASNAPAIGNRTRVRSRGRAESGQEAW